MKIILLTIIYSVVQFSFAQNNVCRTFPDYYLKYNNINCYYNPDIDDEVPEIVRRYNLDVENYTVVTEDGYKLTIFRIPSKETNPKVVFLQHGIQLSSMAFVNVGQKSLAILLAKSGFDVWLGNFRGTRYSINHIHLDANSRQYWNFSFHELGVHDVKEQINFISEKTGNKGDIIYMGFSMGTTASFVYSIIYPELARKNLKVLISLAPVAYLSNLRTPIGHLAPLWEQIEWKISHVTNGALFKRTPNLIAYLKFHFTNSLPGLFRYKKLQQSIFGYDFQQWDPETLPVTSVQNFEAISTKVISHYVQVMLNDDFKYFDYSSNKNMEIYGTTNPPTYNLSKIDVPVYLVYAQNDQLATVENVERLYYNLPDRVKIYGKYKIPYSLFTHDDFVGAKDVKKLLYNDLINFINTTL